MFVIHARNVNEAYPLAMQYLKQEGILEGSRAGEVLVSPVPVVTATRCPRERVLMCPNRDANPFFHLFESLWMLAGRDHTGFLDRFVSDFSERFAEPDGTMHGAYGHRWRRNWDVDQLDVVVERLRDNPEDRRVVISMWDPSLDLIDPRDEDAPTLKDLPCNTHIYPRLRVSGISVSQEVREMPGMPGEFARLQTVPGSEEMKVSRVLDLTVCCRSNDLIWGAYGANIVHFSVLQEYLAARLGAEVGILYQVSNNFHAYTETMASVGTPTVGVDYDACPPAPLVTDPESWDVEVEGFVRDYESGRLDDLSLYCNSWFRDTARPIAVAHDQYREGAKDLAIDTLEDRDQYPNISEDWRTACINWIRRRA